MYKRQQETLAGYFAAQPAAPLHTGMLVGAGTVRASAAGYQVQRLEPAHYAAIHRRLEQALADGALGVSLGLGLSLIHISEPTRLGMISYAVFCLKKKKNHETKSEYR